MSDYQQGERRNGKVIAEYLYDDKDGNPYLKVERTEHKQFPQFHWVRKHGSIKGGYWAFGKPDGPQIPYMLPELIAAPKDQPVWICEGEKDVESVMALDKKWTVTCASEGAGKWSADLNHWFEGFKTVYIIEDNDDAGRRHARKVARNLFRIVEEIRIISIPGLADKEDVTDWIQNYQGNKKRLLELAEKAPRFKGIKTIRLAAGRISEAADATERALMDAQVPIFYRANSLVWPVYTKMPDFRGNVVDVSTFMKYNEHSLMDAVNKHAAIYLKFDKRAKKGEEWQEVDPPEKVMKVLLARAQGPFPTVKGIINTPTLRPDGSLLDKPGFDKATGLWFWPDGNLKLPLEIPEKPTRKEALAALDFLKHLVSEFPFVSEVDRAVAIATIVGAVARGSYEIMPIILMLAHMAGTGKTFFIDLVSTILTGKKAPVTCTPEDRGELEKRLDAAVLKGVPIITLDNCEDDIGHPRLNQITSQSLVSVRPLGTSNDIECDFRGMVFATGNNVSFKGDMIRRGLVVNLDAQTDKPQYRKFDFDPIAMVTADRSKYLAAALTIVRAYRVSKDRVKCPPLNNFQGWSENIREPLIWLGMRDPVESQNQISDDDPDRRATVQLIELWKKYIGIDKVVKSAHVFEVATEMPFAGPPMRPEFHEWMRANATRQGSSRPDTLALGYRLKKVKGVVHERMRIVRVSQDDSNGNNWKLEKLPEAPGGG